MIGSGMKLNGRHLAVVVSMCGLSAATVGLITNLAGLFFTPMAEEFDVLQGASSLVLTIANVCVALGGLATRRLIKMMPLRVLLIAGATVLAGSSLLTALAPSIGVACVLAAMRGLAGGVIGFVLVTYILNKWFIDKLGLVTSLAMGSSGLAGAALTPAVQLVVSGMGWRAGQVAVGVLAALFCLPAILLVPSCDPADAGLRALGAKDVPMPSGRGAGKSPVSVDKPLFVAIVLYSVLMSATSAMPQHFPSLADCAGLGVGLGAAMISASMVANTVGKIAMGWLCDRIGAKRSVMVYAALVALGIAILLLAHNSLAFLVAATLYGLSFSFATVGLSMMCRELFGQHGFGIVYPVGALGCAFSNAVFSSLVGFGYDFTGGYAISLVGFALFIACAATIVLWSYGRHLKAA